MPIERLLEVTVESLDTALAAERGGADRIELCAELAVGGLTPSVATLRKVHEELEIPVFGIIRPRKGDFVYNDKEFAAMLRAIAVARDLALDGIAVGVLREDSTVDVERTREDGKTSSVHFMRFSLSEAQSAAFRDPNVRAMVGCDHPAYAHLAALGGDTSEELAGDLA